MPTQRTVAAPASRRPIPAKDREFEKLLLLASRYFKRPQSRRAKPAKVLPKTSKRTRTKVA